MVILLTPHMWITRRKTSCVLQITRQCIKWNINSTAHIMTKRAHLVPLILQQAVIAMQQYMQFWQSAALSALLSFSFREFSLCKLHF